MSFSWLTNSGTKSEKYQSWAHPLVTNLIHYSTITVVAFISHDLLTTTPKTECLEVGVRRRRITATFVLLYVIFSWVLRLSLSRVPPPLVLYELSWLCNVTLIVGSLGLLLDRPAIATALCVTVGIDQLLWYADLLGYFACGTFVVGVAKYLTWPETHWATRLSCTHHLWTIPLFLHASGGIHVMSLPMSAILMMTSVSLSRLSTPMVMSFSNKGQSEQVKYLNLNLSHELWKDIKWKFLIINHDNPPVFTYLMRLWLRWFGCNILVFGVLYCVSMLVYGTAQVC